MNNASNRGTGMAYPEQKGGFGNVIGALQDKAKDVASTASEFAGQARDKAQEWAGGAAKTAEQAWDVTRHGASDIAAETARRAEEWYDDAGALVRRNPLPALLVALAMGFCLGQCFSFRSDRHS